MKPAKRNQVSFLTVSYENWQVEFSSPVVFEVEPYVTRDGYQMYDAFIKEFPDESRIPSGSQGDLLETGIPEIIIGILCTPCYMKGEKFEQYKYLYNYLKNSVERIVMYPPSGMEFLRIDKETGAVDIQFLPRSEQPPEIEEECPHA
jgi:hypothetical protein